MKDDFYKDIEHTRSDSTKEEKSKHRERKNNVDENFSRSARYKKDDKNKDKVKNNKNEKSNSAKNNEKKKVATAGLFANSKHFLKKKSSHYKKQLSSELGESKTKLRDLKEESVKKFKPRKNNNKKSILLLLLVLLPLTIILGFMIVSNFWPTGNEIENQVATEEKEDNKNEINKEFENKKAEMEKQFAEKDEDNKSKKNDKSNDNDKSDENTSKNNASKEYSKDEIQSLDKAGDNAISSKKENDEKSQKLAEEKQKEEEARLEQERESEEKSNTEENTDEEDDKKELENDDTDDDNKDGQTHVVSSKDNLYRIAINYYGSGSEENVQKIRDANGISGNSLSVGQELIIP